MWVLGFELSGLVLRCGRRAEGVCEAQGEKSEKRETWGMGETEEVVLSCEFWVLSSELSGPVLR